MGLFDNYNFGGPTNPLDGLLSLISQQSQYNPQGAGLEPTGWTQDYGQQRNVAVGDYQMPQFGNAPKPNPMDANAQIPPNAQPTMGQLPQQTAPMAQGEPGIGDRLSGFFNGYANNKDRGVLGGLAGAITGLATGSAPQNQTVKALIARGLDPTMAQQAARDPALLRSVLAGQLKNQMQANDPLWQLEVALKRRQLGKSDAPTGVQEYEYYADQTLKSGGKPLPYSQWDASRRRAGATNVNTGTIPQGYELVQDPVNGTQRLQPIPGGPKDTSAADAAKADSRAISTDIVTGAAQKARDAIRSSYLPATGTAGALVSGIGETGSAEVYRQVEALKANAKMENLQAMRAASPTGGALGNVSDAENAMLAAKSGALDPKSPHFLRDLDDYERSLLRIVHGKEAGDKIFEQTRKSDDSWQDVGGVKIRKKQ